MSLYSGFLCWFSTNFFIQYNLLHYLDNTTGCSLYCAHNAMYKQKCSRKNIIWRNIPQFCQRTTITHEQLQNNVMSYCQAELSHLLQCALPQYKARQNRKYCKACDTRAVLTGRPDGPSRRLVKTATLTHIPSWRPVKTRHHGPSRWAVSPSSPKNIQLSVLQDGASTNV